MEKIRLAKALRRRENALFKGKPPMFFHRFTQAFTSVDVANKGLSPEHKSLESATSALITSNFKASQRKRKQLGAAKDKRSSNLNKHHSSTSEPALSKGKPRPIEVPKRVNISIEPATASDSSDERKGEHPESPSRASASAAKTHGRSVPKGHKGPKQRKDPQRRLCFETPQKPQQQNEQKNSNRTGGKLTLRLATKLKRSFRAKVRPKQFKSTVKTEKEKQEEEVLAQAKRSVRERIVKNRQISAILDASRRKLRHAVKGLWADKAQALRTVLDLIRSTAVQQVEAHFVGGKVAKDKGYLPKLLHETKRSLELLVQKKERKGLANLGSTQANEGSFRERLEQALDEVHKTGFDFRPLERHGQERIQLMSLEEFKQEHPEAQQSTGTRKARSVSKDTRKLLSAASVGSIVEAANVAESDIQPKSKFIQKQKAQPAGKAIANDVRKVDKLLSILHER